jgi:hypothetical protein
MSVEKKPYTIEFRYTDNDEIYLDHVLLTDKQFERVQRFLAGLGKAGEIADYNGYKGEPGVFIAEYSPAIFDSFEGLVDRWKDGSLVDKGTNLGLVL